MQGQLSAMQGQANTLRDSLEQTRKAANAAVTQANASKTQAAASTVQAQIAKQTAGAVVSSARAAEQSAQTAAQSFTIGERPFLYFKIVTMNNFEVGKSPHIEVFVANAGRTAAYKITLEIDYAITIPAVSNSLVYHGGGTTSGSNYELSIPAAGELKLNTATPFQLNESQVNFLKNGIARFYFYGKGYYFSELGKKYPFTFCYVYDKDSNSLIICTSDVKPK